MENPSSCPLIKGMFWNVQVIEPQFQRDFISLLPKELALYVLAFLHPKDLLRSNRKRTGKYENKGKFLKMDIGERPERGLRGLILGSLYW
jgi:hypothetical protein